MRRFYVVPKRWMVIYEYEVPGGTLNLSSSKLPRPWSPWKSSPTRKNPHDRTGNQTRDIMISSQKLLPLDHEDGQHYLASGYLYNTKCATSTVCSESRCATIKGVAFVFHEP
jgi:hypothetical protein